MLTYLDILVYSYLLPVLSVLFIKKELRVKKEVLVIVIYGLLFFCLLKFQILFSDNPYFTKSLKKIFFAFYTFIEFFSFSLIYWINFKNKKIKFITSLTVIFFIIFQVIIFFTVKFKSMDNIPIAVETILVYFYIFYFFYEYFISIESEYVYDNYCFWLSIGIMIYLGGSFFIYILANHTTEAEDEKFWYLTYIAETIKNIFFAVAVFVYAKQRSKDKIPNQNIPYLDYN